MLKLGGVGIVEWMGGWWVEVLFALCCVVSGSCYCYWCFFFPFLFPSRSGSQCPTLAVSSDVDPHPIHILGPKVISERCAGTLCCELARVAADDAPSNPRLGGFRLCRMVVPFFSLCCGLVLVVFFLFSFFPCASISAILASVAGSMVIHPM